MGAKTSALTGYRPGKLWIPEAEPLVREVQLPWRTRTWRLLARFIFDYNRY